MVNCRVDASHGETRTKIARSEEIFPALPEPKVFPEELQELRLREGHRVLELGSYSRSDSPWVGMRHGYEPHGPWPAPGSSRCFRRNSRSCSDVRCRCSRREWARSLRRPWPRQSRTRAGSEWSAG